MTHWRSAGRSVLGVTGVILVTCIEIDHDLRGLRLGADGTANRPRRLANAGFRPLRQPVGRRATGRRPRGARMAHRAENYTLFLHLSFFFLVPGLSATLLPQPF